jgi:hypothetical protein
MPQLRQHFQLSKPQRGLNTLDPGLSASRLFLRLQQSQKSLAKITGAIFSKNEVQ